MRICRMFHRNAQSCLVYVCGRGVEGERYVIEKYRSLADGQIRPVEAERSGTILSAGAVKKLRPQRDGIIVCAALNLKASGIQYWGLIDAKPHYGICAPAATPLRPDTRQSTNIRTGPVSGGPGNASGLYGSGSQGGDRPPAA